VAGDLTFAIIKDSRASVVDLGMTQAVDGDMVKVMSWYGNEWEIGTLYGPHGAPDFFTAIQEQLGLRLDARRAPVDTFVIDHIERPTEN